MPLTKLDGICALIVVDLQKGIAALPTVHPAKEIIDRSAQLARAFRQRGWPVVLVHVTGMLPHRTDARMPKFAFPPDWTDFVPELDPQDEDLIVEKRTWGAFLGNDLHDQLRQRDVTQIVLTGIATSAGVESTARSAFDLGYNVTFVIDAMTDRDAGVHSHTVEKIFPRLGEAAATNDVLKLLRE